MSNEQEIRVDKWLWAVRIFKTRSQSTEACRKGRVFIEDQEVKPSRLLRINDTVRVKKPPLLYSYKVLGLPGNRLPAKTVREFAEDLTPEAELEKLKIRETFFIARKKGSGRPTKKERRILDKLRGERPE